MGDETKLDPWGRVGYDASKIPWHLADISLFGKGGKWLQLNAIYRGINDGTNCNVSVYCTEKMRDLLVELDKLIRERIDMRLRISPKYIGAHEGWEDDVKDQD